jgi:tetratricopeptide (TPR) repeat protein
MPGVFISYRRDDRAWAGRLADHLNIRFGEDMVWRDVEDIKPGKKWLKEIRDAIAGSDVFIVVIGPNWLQDKKGYRRLEDPDDVLLKELQAALKSNLEVFPVLVGGAEIPKPGDLPSSVKKLLDFQAAQLRDGHWAKDVLLLIDSISDTIRKHRKRLPLSEIHRSINQKESEYFGSLDGEPQRALDLSREVLKLLDEQMPLYPNDQYLQVLRGYFLKNEAMALRNCGDHDQFDAKLKHAARYFNTVLDENKGLYASALNGIGSVEMLQGRFKEALTWIDKALEIEPGYEAARSDRQTVLQYLSGDGS